MQNSDEENSNGYLSEEETERYFRLLEELPEFARLFDYGEPSDRAVAIVGPAFLDRLLKEALVNFLIDDEKELVESLLGKNGPLGTFGSRITVCYCLGFIGEIVKSDLRLVGKIRMSLLTTSTPTSQIHGSVVGAELYDGTKSSFHHRPVMRPIETCSR